MTLAQAQAPLKNICCVGDDDQSIYGWRGAEVDNILRFEHDFPGAKVVRLERNYRSTGHILDAASTLIAKNQGRLGKTLRTEDVAGEKVTVTGAWDSEEEARLVGEEIEALHANKHDLSEIAILVRISAQMREIEDRLVQTRHRRPPLLRAGRDPRRARLSARDREPGRRPRLRAHRQRAEARARRRDPQRPPQPRPPGRDLAHGGGALRRRDRGA
jgi:superfamily I DNA/RNA helicase